MGEYGIGQPVRRFEDKRLLSGNGRFQSDNNLLGQAYAYVLRSPHAHARIRKLDLAAAQSAQGVALIMTAADLLANQTPGLTAQPSPHPLERRLVFKNIGREGWTTDIDSYLQDGGYEECKDVHIRAIFDEKGRIMVIATHNVDNGDGWEREGEYQYFFSEFSEKRAYPLGINIIFYLMTH